MPRARLRRAATPIDALEEPSVFDLYKKLGFSRVDFERRLPRVAVTAAVLAHIRTDGGDKGFRRRFAEMLGQGGERRVLRSHHRDAPSLLVRDQRGLHAARPIDDEAIGPQRRNSTDRGVGRHLL